MLRTLLFLFLTPAVSLGQSITMAESFEVGRTARTDLKVELTGEVAVPGQAKRIDIQGLSTLRYDERILRGDDGLALLRVYRDVDFQRVINGERQSQAIRPAVRRMVVLRSPEGKKAPFSPDGPLMFGEIDAVRVDLFAPVLVSGLLPAKAVKSGESWAMTKSAAIDLTGLESIDSGELTVTLIGTVVIQGRSQHRLAITGSVRGQSEDGPTRQTIDATAYFDPKPAMLTYLSLKGIQELLDEKGNIAGRLTGRLTMTREPSTSDAVSESVAMKISARPTEETTKLLFDNPSLGLQFTYPRHWRVGAVQGRQVTLEAPKSGAGMLMTVESKGQLPSADQYLTEAQSFVTGQKGKVIATEKPRSDGSMARFGMDVEMNNANIRMEYAVVKGTDGGATIAARLPKSTARELAKEIDAIVGSVMVRK